MSMLIQLSLWDGLPSPTATYVQQLLFWSHWHFFITEGAEGLQQLHHRDVLSRDTLSFPLSNFYASSLEEHHHLSGQQRDGLTWSLT